MCNDATSAAVLSRGSKKESERGSFNQLVQASALYVQRREHVREL